MKNNKIEIIGSFLVIGILGIMFLCSIFFTIIPKILIRLDLTNDSINEFFQITKPEVRIDFSKIYPYEKNNIEINKNTITDKYLSNINFFKEKIENSTSKGLYGYEKFIELSYIYDNLISYKIKSNTSSKTRIEINDGYFSEISKKKNVEDCSNSLIEFNNYLKSLNIDFLYVQAPFKISPNEQLEKIYIDYTNQNVDTLLKSIDKKVNYIDLREEIKLDNLDHLKLFFKTDHHWLPETGLWATNKISNYLNDNYNLNLEIDNINKNKFNYEIYEDIYLGSDGRYVSLANAKPENFTLITPKYSTKFNIEILEKNLNNTGSYQDVLIDMSKLKNKNFYKISQYDSYLYGDCQLIEINNQYVKNGKKILLIKDSFGNVVSPFLALENEYLSIIDLRHFNGSLKSYIKNFNPDVVIALYNGSMLVDKGEISSEKQDYLWNNLNK